MNMTRKSLLFASTLLGLYHLIHPETVPHIEVPVKVNVNNYMDQKSSHLSSQTQSTQTTQFNFAQAQKKIAGIWHLITQAMRKNKRTLCIGVILSIYAYYWGRIWWIGKKLSHPTSWAHWHNQLDTETLITIPAHQITQELMEDIQTRYFNPQRPHDFLHPIVTFFNTTTAEINSYTYLINCYKLFERLHIKFLFPKNRRIYQQAEAAIIKLKYLQQLIVTMLSKEKIAQLTCAHSAMTPVNA